MKKDEQAVDKLRPEYRCEDFGPMARGKYDKKSESVTPSRGSGFL